MNFEVGDKVKHPEYGKGKVIDLDTMTHEVCVYFKEPIHGFHVLWCYAGNLTKQKNQWHSMSDRPQGLKDHTPVEVKLKSGKKELQLVCLASHEAVAFHRPEGEDGCYSEYTCWEDGSDAKDPVVAWRYHKEKKNPWHLMPERPRTQEKETQVMCCTSNLEE